MTRRFHPARTAIALATPVFAAACATVAEAPGETHAAPGPVPAPVYALNDVLGVSGDAVDALLGPPALTRREGAGEYRRYGLKSCALIVILYPDEAGAPKTAHVDAAALTSEEEKPDLAACLAAG